MRLLQKVGGVLPGWRKAGPGDRDAPAPGPSAPPPAPRPSDSPPPAPSVPQAGPAAPRNGTAASIPEFPDLDLMALLPPELRQPAAPPSSPPREAPADRRPPATGPGPVPDRRQAVGPFSAAATGSLRPSLSDALPDPFRPTPQEPAATGFAAFLAEGLRHLDAPDPAPDAPRPAPPPVAVPDPPAVTPADPGLPADLSLAPAREIAGLVAACLADADSGLLLAAEGRGLDPDAAAAHGTEVLRAVRAAIAGLDLDDDLDDMLVTTGRRLMVIRPLQRLPEIFLFLVLDRNAANLGTVRFQLDRIERGLGP